MNLEELVEVYRDRLMHEFPNGRVKLFRPQIGSGNSWTSIVVLNEEGKEDYLGRIDYYVDEADLEKLLFN